MRALGFGVHPFSVYAVGDLAFVKWCCRGTYTDTIDLQRGSIYVMQYITVRELVRHGNVELL